MPWPHAFSATKHARAQSNLRYTLRFQRLPARCSSALALLDSVYVELPAQSRLLSMLEQIPVSDALSGPVRYPFDAVPLSLCSMLLIRLNVDVRCTLVCPLVCGVYSGVADGLMS